MPNTIDARPRGPNHPTKTTVVRFDPLPIKAERDGNHPEDRQRQQRENEHPPCDVIEQVDSQRADNQPDQQSEQLADLFAELTDLTGVGLRAPEHQPADEGGDEPVAIQLERHEVGDESQGRHQDRD